MNSQRSILLEFFRKSQKMMWKSESWNICKTFSRDSIYDTLVLGSWTNKRSLLGTVTTSTSLRLSSFLLRGRLRTQTVIWWSSTTSESRIGRKSNVPWNSLAKQKQKNQFLFNHISSIHPKRASLIYFKWINYGLILEKCI